MDKTIITSLLVIAGMISAVFVFNTMYPAVVQSSDALLGMERRIDERVKSQIDVIHAVADGEVTSTALAWVKNTGSLSVKGLDRCDLFFGPEGDYQRIPYDAGLPPEWTYTIENDTTWKPSATIKVTIDLASNLTDGERYYVKFVLPNGVSDDYYFTHAGS